MTQDDFRLHLSGEIREALIMIEGDDGCFQLLRHGVTIPSESKEGVPYAVVRSTDSGRLHFLIRDPGSSGPYWRHWHEIGLEDLQGSSGRLIGEEMGGAIHEPSIPPPEG